MTLALCALTAEACLTVRRGSEPIILSGARSLVLGAGALLLGGGLLALALAGLSAIRLRDAVGGVREVWRQTERL